MPFEEDDKDPRIWFLDHNYHESMFSMFKRINAKEHVVGWYNTGPKLKEKGLDVHALFTNFYCLVVSTPSPSHLLQSKKLRMFIIDLHLTNTTSATTSPTRAHWQRRPRSSPPLIARARPTWMVSAKANASEDVVPEFVGDLIPFDKARVTTSVSPWTAREIVRMKRWRVALCRMGRWEKKNSEGLDEDDGNKLIGLDLNLSSLCSLVILFPATFRCITLMPMKGEILVDTMEKTLKPGGFLKSGLIETEGPLEAVKGHL
ncbi:putative 26S proteasome non-ATPase regulatory subunit 7 [Triticum urartu]|uniref:Putative 26S proteasome non-ATPase regulatory subunit 7 n=1 Tax=Triticum urartu TaxID=4572 RepID=M7ZHY1_TRIUA|nr:putative 26S proteasome non-ATPase regulatory subunit 7 [Triticum urartu]